MDKIDRGLAGDYHISSRVADFIFRILRQGPDTRCAIALAFSVRSRIDEEFLRRACLPTTTKQLPVGSMTLNDVSLKSIDASSSLQQHGDLMSEYFAKGWHDEGGNKYYNVYTGESVWASPLNIGKADIWKTSALQLIRNGNLQRDGGSNNNTRWPNYYRYHHKQRRQQPVEDDIEFTRRRRKEQRQKQREILFFKMLATEAGRQALNREMAIIERDILEGCERASNDEELNLSLDDDDETGFLVIEELMALQIIITNQLRHWKDAFSMKLVRPGVLMLKEYIGSTFGKLTLSSFVSSGKAVALVASEWAHAHLLPPDKSRW